MTYTILNMAIIFFGWPYMGFLGIGVSFFIAQFCAMTFTYVYSYLKFGIYIERENRTVIILAAIALVAAYVAHEYLSGMTQILVSALVLVLVCLYAVHKLDSIVNIHGVLKKLRKR